MLPLAFALLFESCIDSELESTRGYWRRKYAAATEDEARDPRPWREVVAARKQQADQYLAHLTHGGDTHE